jgi:hypothetical protein
MSDPADPNRTPPGAPTPPAGSSMPPAPPPAYTPSAPPSAYPQPPAGTSAAPSPGAQVTPTVGQVPPPPPPPSVPQPPSPVDNMAAAMSGMLGKMTKGEQLALAGAAVVVFISFLLFGFILATYGGFTELSVTAGIALLAVVWLKTEKQYDIGANYGLIVVLLCLSIAVPAGVSLLITLRQAVTPFGLGSGLSLIADLSFWIGGALAAVGGWWVWKGR